YPKDAAGEKSVADIADVMLPHLGANTKEANFNAAKRAAEQMVAYFEEGITSCVVNKGVPDGLDASYQKLAGLLASLGRAYLNGRAVSKIEMSFYGKLNPFAKWMLAPVVAGLCPDFDAFRGADEAAKVIAERGIVTENREVDENKHYGESITLDFISGADRISRRGTITESKVMVSRINTFENVYLNPEGNNLFVEYEDAPGILGKITGLLGNAGININDIRAPQDLQNNRSLAVVKTNIPVPADLVAKIAAEVNAKNAFAFED
ncbi:MAG: ACT domain-containing protein, partial [Lentisphaeria bacterium]|nr:ACT domain-containing protein [Lentisphaeria bacterium]